VLKKQVEQNQKEYFKVVEENDALKKTISRLQDELTKKSPVDKKTD